MLSFFLFHFTSFQPFALLWIRKEGKERKSRKKEREKLFFFSSLRIDDNSPRFYFNGVLNKFIVSDYVQAKSKAKVFSLYFLYSERINVSFLFFSFFSFRNLFSSLVVFFLFMECVCLKATNGFFFLFLFLSLSFFHEFPVPYCLWFLSFILCLPPPPSLTRSPCWWTMEA